MLSKYFQFIQNPILKKITIGSTITGGIFGQIIGIKLGYKQTSCNHIIANLFTTCIYGFTGCVYGTLFGMTWFITVPIIIYRINSDMKIESNRNNIMAYLQKNLLL